jgi:prepilin-type N-terminal cleavage/methylation domain-containing protein
MSIAHRPDGLSVVELMIVLVIAAVLVLLAAPSFQSLLDRQRVRGVASNLNGDIQFARSESVRRNAAVTVSFSAGSTPWCYGIVNGTAACDCTTAGACDLKTVSGADYKDVALTLTGGSGFTIDPRAGQVAAVAGGGSGAVTTAITFASTTTASAQVQSQLNALGRVLQCSPGDGIVGYPEC